MAPFFKNFLHITFACPRFVDEKEVDRIDFDFKSTSMVGIVAGGIAFDADSCIMQASQVSGPAIDNLNGSQLDELVVTDSIPLSAAARDCSKIRQLSISEMLAETMRRIHYEESVSSLFMD